MIIQTVIPQSLRDSGSIHGSRVGGNGDEAKATTEFVQNQLLQYTEDDWTPAPLPLDVVDIPWNRALAKNQRELAYLSAAAPGFHVMNVNADNQFNVKVDIQDSNRDSVHLSARVDYLVVPSANIDKQMPLVEIFRYTIVFIEVESNKKGMELAELQLMTSLLAVSHFIGHMRVYGIVISADFDKARLVKLDQHACFADGYFHPSVLGAVVEMILKREIV